MWYSRDRHGQVFRLSDFSVIGDSVVQWFVINPPGYAPATAVLLAEIHGCTGYFPAIVRLRPVAGTTPTRHEVAEVINQQAVRDAARTRRKDEPAG